MTSSENRICVGQFGAPQGVKGLLRLKSFCDPADNIFSYTLTDESGQPLKLQSQGTARDFLVVRVPGVDSRTAAERLTNARVYTERSQLPAIEGEYYIHDLIGLSVKAADRAGKVIDLFDFGAGPVLEVEWTGGKREMIAFQSQVERVDLDAGEIRLHDLDVWEVKS